VEGSTVRERRLYTISVAAELVSVQQTLRHYERLGLVEPLRGKGEIRYYSPQDIERIQQIRRLVEKLGVNLAGEVILNMRDQLERLRSESIETISRMREEHESETRRLKEIIRRLQGIGDGKQTVEV
jgi:MerR family transcriptional regulator/heat shock protein HspR